MHAQIAFYKGPPVGDWQHTVSHYSIRVWTLSKYSHAELVIDGWCYSSSARDGGVRRKLIDLTSGRWDVVDIECDTDAVLAWFLQHDGENYDWAGICRFVVPFLPHRQNQWFCFEALAAALGQAAAHKFTANDLVYWAQLNPHKDDELTEPQ
jgi:hypothetical protein